MKLDSGTELSQERPLVNLSDEVHITFVGKRDAAVLNASREPPVEDVRRLYCAAACLAVHVQFCECVLVTLETIHVDEAAPAVATRFRITISACEENQTGLAIWPSLLRNATHCTLCDAPTSSIVWLRIGVVPAARDRKSHEQYICFPMAIPSVDALQPPLEDHLVLRCAIIFARDGALW